MPHFLPYDVNRNLKRGCIEATLLKAKSMGNELSTKQKREWAEMLFMRAELTQKQIAEKVDVSEKTMTTWVKKYNWEDLRKSMLTTKTEILRTLYGVLEKISLKMKEEGAGGDSKQADAFVKYTTAIKNLETETSISEISEVGRMFVDWLRLIDPQFALLVLEHMDNFIKEKLKRF